MSVKTKTRRAQIIEIARERSVVSVDSLANILGVSAQTVRRDINRLCNDDILRRRHGGAEFPSATQNISYDLRQTQNSDAKQAIGRRAAKLVPDGSIIFISIGTTPAIVAGELRKKTNLTVVTNNLNAAMALSVEVSNRIIVPGGEMRLPDRDILGDEAVELIGRYRADFGIYGVGGIDQDGSLLDFHHSEVQVRQRVLENCRTAILVADQTKFGRSAPAIGGHISEADFVIIDQQPGAIFSALCESISDRLLLAKVH